MKICIICPDERNYLPHIKKYTDFFDENGISYDVIFWYHDEEPSADKKTLPNEHCFYEKDAESFFGKFKNAGHYKKFVLDILKKNKYDRLVILNSLIAVLLQKYLHSEFENKYLLDYRNCSFEQVSFYRRAVNKAIEASSFTAISSHGFMDFLDGNKKIIVNHNIAGDIPTLPPQELKDKSVINIGFVGKINHYEENCMLISKLKNEFRYQLWYLGKADIKNNLDGYCKANGVTNVSFVGKYINSQKAELYKNMDMVNAIYGDDSLGKRSLLPTRLYDACLLRKPIIASRNTFLGEVIERYNLGLVVDVDEDDVLSAINEYVEDFDIAEFDLGCCEFLSDVQNDEDTLFGCLRQFIKDKKPKKKQKK